MKPFTELTLRGQARRLRVLAESALAVYVLNVRRIRLLHIETNCTFRVDTYDGRSYALRISRPNVFTPTDIRSELAWQEAVGRDTGIIVPAPVPARAGDVVITASAAGVPEPRHCVVFEWLRGRHMAEQINLVTAEEWGRLAALLHRHGLEWNPPQEFTARTMNRLFPFGDPNRLDSPRGRDLIPDELRPLIERMVAAVTLELTRLYSQSDKPGLVHGDLHGWNIKVNAGKLQLFDFEDLCFAYPIQDIATSFFYIAPKPDFAELKAAFRAGYETIRAWPEEYSGQIELLIVHRVVDTLNYALSWKGQAGEEFMEEVIEGLKTHDRHIFEIWEASAI